MKVYVAGNHAHDRWIIAHLALTLEQHGHTVTYKWWEEEMSPARKAAADIDGVREADVLVCYVASPWTYRGLWVEVGAALALGKRVYFLGEAENDCIFKHHRLAWTLSANQLDVLLKLLEA